jgi:hypothetical protein
MSYKLDASLSKNVVVPIVKVEDLPKNTLAVVIQHPEPDVVGHILLMGEDGFLFDLTEGIVWETDNDEFRDEPDVFTARPLTNDESITLQGQ